MRARRPFRVQAAGAEPGASCSGRHLQRDPGQRHRLVSVTAPSCLGGLIELPIGDARQFCGGSFPPG